MTTSYLITGYIRFNKLQDLYEIFMGRQHRFTIAGSIFDHQFLNDIVEISFLFSSPYPAPSLPSFTLSFLVIF